MHDDGTKALIGEAGLTEQLKLRDKEVPPSPQIWEIYVSALSSLSIGILINPLSIHMI